jgi:hypothetical protein
LNPVRCHRRTVSGCTIFVAPSRLGQSQVTHTSNARSLPRIRRCDGAGQGDAELMAKEQVLGFWPAPIDPNHAMILPHNAD